MSTAKSSPDTNSDSMTKDESQVAEHVSAEDKSSFYSFIKTVASFSGDLSQLTCPGFLLCGSSILEYCSHYGDYPVLFNDIARANDSLERTAAVTRWFLSTLYGSFRSRCKDTFEKKPYNPILGEKFMCQLKDADENILNLRCEQVSHHPPVSALYLESPSAGVYLIGHCGQKSKFKGTSIKVEQVGHVTVSVLGCDEYFVITLPGTNIRSLVTGRPFLDLYGESYVYSSAGYVATIVYQQKPWFGGDYFGIEGNIKDSSGKILKNISGKMDRRVYYH
ncbi:Oxysterol-binding protein 4 [Entomophthora muscae]|uniref:Oxysterol-binding protein 4 n=1 Tax=Entomophthora muscae TaxID=34485 RepID=A0ACC2SFK3_9FUNG|nr:Oxysterol-binding protein 4 [Entomophthora muscae]